MPLLEVCESLERWDGQLGLPPGLPQGQRSGQLGGHGGPWWVRSFAPQVWTQAQQAGLFWLLAWMVVARVWWPTFGLVPLCCLDLPMK